MNMITDCAVSSAVSAAFLCDQSSYRILYGASIEHN